MEYTVTVSGWFNLSHLNCGGSVNISLFEMLQLFEELFFCWKVRKSETEMFFFSLWFSLKQMRLDDEMIVQMTMKQITDPFRH